ncbi:MAG: PD-(D/E)XK nuclease family protein [Lachnospiraceae bacterium]|nr:PD-(D/E)XK nuclease family protein [Lachnospiraceae bacterium]
MLHLVLGASGTGKSYELLGRAIDGAEKDRKRNLLIVVPEQFTLHVQREIVERSPNHGIMNIDILSFPRLAHRVFEEIGYEPPVILEDSGKTMIVKKVVLDKAEELGIFKGKIHKQGFIEQMKSVIAEFYQYSIGPEEVKQMIEMASDRAQLKSKLKDIDVIYRGFRDFIKERFIMNEELLEIFTEKIGRSRVLKDSTIIFDGFTGFTSMQLKCMERLLGTAKDVYVSITADPKALESVSAACDTNTSEKKDNGSLFALSLLTMQRLQRIADNAGVEVDTEFFGDDIPYRFRNNPALASIERSLFRRPVIKCNDTTGISLVSCESPSAELRYVIGRIKGLTANENYRYGDIAVITGDLETYENLAAREFERAGIPFFQDSKKSIIGTEPVELLRSVIMTALRGYDASSVFRFLKSSLSGFYIEEVSKLENYCLAKSVRGESYWRKEWTKKYRSHYSQYLPAFNEMREQICDILIEPASKLAKDITVSERVDILRQLLEKLKIEDKLETIESKNKESQNVDERLAALEAGQLYGKIMAIFERIEKLLGDDIVSLKEFSEILDTGFREAKLAMIPQDNDHVLIGDMERTRLGDVKALFFIGANDGMVPKPRSSQGLLSYSDRLLFEENEVELSPVGLRSSYLQEFYLYLNMTKPSEKLCMTYHRMTADKKPGHRSVIFSEIMKIYPELKITDVLRTDREMLIGSDSGKFTAARVMRDNAPDGLSEAERTICAVIGRKSPEEYAMLLKAAFEYRKNASITQKSAKELYGDVLKGSVTRLEKYAACAYSHFLRYGLQLEERPEFRVGAIELGNIYHKAVEIYGLELQKRNIEWHDTTQEQRSKILDAALDAALAEYDEIIGSSSRNTYIRNRAKRVLERTIKVLDFQVKGGGFEPKYFEESFKAAGKFMELAGKIDRIDISEKNGKKYLRVIDYKSGKKNFDLVRLYNGLQIQLAVYLNEAVEMYNAQTGDEAITAGIYYYNIDDPILENVNEALKSAEVEKLINSKLKLKGPSNQENDSLMLSDGKLFDSSGKPDGGYSSDIISAKFKKDGVEFDKKNSNVMEADKFKKAAEYAMQLMERSSELIYDGDIKINPTLEGKYSACAYCPYNAVCGFEYRLGYRYRAVKKEDSEELWEKIAKKQMP